MNILFPIVTSPYTSRILGAENIGKVNYANAIITWFVLFSSFGIPTYGIRAIAVNRDNKQKVSHIFSNLMAIKIILTIICLGLYSYLIINNEFFKEDIMLYLVMNITLILNIFSIDWFYQGMEHYGFVMIRSVIVKFISLTLIFMMIHKQGDYVIFAVINIFATGFNNILSYIHAKKYVHIEFKDLKICYYFKELRVFFLSSLVISLYTQLDQILIGNLPNKSDLAFYLKSKLLLNMGLTLTNSLTTVLIPRASFLVKNDFNEYKKIIQYAFNYIIMISLPSAIGLGLLSKELMYCIGGEEFVNGSIGLIILSVLIIVISLGTFMFNQIFIPNGDEQLGTKLQLLSATISVLLNIILIPQFSYIGAAVTWVITEIIITLISGLIINKKYKEIKIKYFNISVLKYFIAGVIMAMGIIGVKYFIREYISSLLICLFISPLVYFIVIIILKENLVISFIRTILNKIKLSH